MENFSSSKPSYHGVEITDYTTVLGILQFILSTLLLLFHVPTLPVCMLNFQFFFLSFIRNFNKFDLFAWLSIWSVFSSLEVFIVFSEFRSNICFRIMLSVAVFDSLELFTFWLFTGLQIFNINFDRRTEKVFFWMIRNNWSNNFCVELRKKFGNWCSF